MGSTLRTVPVTNLALSANVLYNPTPNTTQNTGPIIQRSRARTTTIGGQSSGNEPAADIGQQHNRLFGSLVSLNPNLAAVSPSNLQEYRKG